MSDTIHIVATPPSTQPAPPQWPLVAAPKRPRRWPTVTLLVMVVFLAGVAIVGWLRPLPDHTPANAPPKSTHTDQQTADAKAHVCAAYRNVHQAVRVNFARDRGTDPTAQLASAVNARQALLAGSQYLQTTLAQEPATPPDLAKVIQTLANTFQKLTVDYLAEVSESEVDSLQRASDQTTATIEGICK